MKGVILAGGEGTRLRPLTAAVNKHLLPIGDVPMIFHPLGKLIDAGIREVLIVSSADGVAGLGKVLGSGRDRGADICYRVQDRPGGIAEALSLAESFAAAEPIVVILGDNLFTDDLGPHLEAFNRSPEGALVFLKRVADPQRFGVAVFDGDRIVDIVEKPAQPPSDFAVTGIYVYDHRFADVVRGLSPSDRGELEVSDLNAAYVRAGMLRHVELEGPWIDAGTPESYREAVRRFAAPTEAP